MRVFIADKFEQSGIDDLIRMGCEVIADAGKKGPELTAAIRDSGAKILIVRSTKVTKEVIEAAGELALIIRAGAGVDNIDVAAASARGIFVTNCPGMNAVAVAELAFALILSLDRRVPDCVAELRAGKWNKAEYSKARGLKDRTLGIIGFGPIGRAVAERAVAFEMNVLGWSRSLVREGAAVQSMRVCQTAREVADQSDIVSIHIASTPETKRLCDREFFDAMKPGAYFINTSRGDVVDAEALAAAIKSKSIRAGLDVYAAEPAQPTADFKDPLFGLPGVVYGTPHIAASTDQAQSAIAAETVRLVEVFRETGRVENCINLLPRSHARKMLIVRHFNRPGVLAHVLSHIGHANINVEEMENVILKDEHTAVARIRLAAAPPPTTLEAIRTGCEHIIAQSLVDLPA